MKSAEHKKQINEKRRKWTREIFHEETGYGVDVRDIQRGVEM